MHVVVTTVDLDHARRFPDELVLAWPDFGRLQAAAADGGSLRFSIVQASWQDGERTVEGIRCHFVREPDPVVRLPGGRTVRRVSRRLALQVKALRPDVVHFSGLGFARDLRALRRVFPDTPIVAQAHSAKIPAGWRRWFFRWGTEALDAAMFCARAEGDNFKKHHLLPRRLPIFEVIEMSTSFSPGNALASKAELRLDGNPCLFWLGNLDSNKDPLMVLDAVAAAAAELPAARLYMSFRHAALLDQVHARIASDPNLKTRVVLLGELPHRAVEAHLRAADFVVQGSHREGSGAGIIEALACGATPLVTNIPSFRKITDEGRFGAIVPAGDSAALAREIVAWSARDRPTLRCSARQHFERQLSFEAVGRQLRETYAQVAELRGA
jgi:glycosyltransferase involved in cell wall biosynthesis